MEIHRAINSDLKELAEIYMTEFSKPPYDEDWTFDKAISKMKKYNGDFDLYTITLDNEIIGFVVINPNFMCPGEVAFGEEFAIRSDYQNKGIGTQAINQLFKIYKERGFKRFMGIADVDSRAYKLYLKLGILPSKKDVLIEKELN